VLRDVASLRLVTGQQLERLHFAELGEPSRAVVRRRVLRRLTNWCVLATLERRIGGVRAGSAGLVFALGVAGKRLLAGDAQARRPNMPGERYIRHVLAVSQLYVDLVEHEREGALRLDAFAAEPASWWPNGRGGLLKPDAYAAVSGANHMDHWWIEVDLATEHLPTLRRKLMTYVEFYREGQLGPGDLMPWVLVTVPDAKRYSDVVRLIRQLPPVGQELITVAAHKEAADSVVRNLSQP
jgi:Replication-relaxation